MPQRNPTKNPTAFVGSTIMSGAPNTGQSLWTPGGTHTHSNMSGTAGGDANIWVGGGRLDLVVINPPASAAAAPAASGIMITFYDSAAAVSGGPLSTSGHKILAKLTPVTEAQQGSFIFNSGLGVTGRVIPLGIAFWSGLCVTGASGAVGFTASYTPVVSGTQVGGTSNP